MNKCESSAVIWAECEPWQIGMEGYSITAYIMAREILAWIKRWWLNISLPVNTKEESKSKMINFSKVLGFPCSVSKSEKKNHSISALLV